MPKKVDHEARRQEISEALWRLASARGLEGASLRDVAAEAGISLGRLQHYFRSKDEMLLFALRHINRLAGDRIRERIEALPEEPTPREVLRACLSGMLPLDEKSRVGVLVGAAYFARAAYDESLRAEAKNGIPQLRALFADQLRRAAERGELPRNAPPRTRRCCSSAWSTACPPTSCSMCTTPGPRCDCWTCIWRSSSGRTGLPSVRRWRAGSDLAGVGRGVR